MVKETKGAPLEADDDGADLAVDRLGRS